MLAALALAEVVEASLGAGRVVLSMTGFVTSLNSGVLNLALPTLVRDIHATNSQLQWIVDAYALVFAGSIAPKEDAAGGR